MINRQTIAITGVTGYLGGQVARQLAQAGIVARLLARSPERAPELAGMTIYEAYYDESPATLKALEGVDVLFMVSARESQDRTQEHKGFIDAAKKAGVQHIIYTSFLNAKADATFTYARDHAWTENYIKDSGFTYTFIRDNFYMDFFVDLCREYGEIKGPAGQGCVSAVVREDVVAVVAAVLQDPKSYCNQILDMTGPESLSMAEIAAIYSQEMGKEVTYIEETVQAAYESRKAWPAEDWEYDGWVSTYTAIANDELSAISQDIQRVLGRPATCLSDFLSFEKAK